MTEKDAGGETLAQGIPQERGEDPWVTTPRSGRGQLERFHLEVQKQ